MLHELNLEWLPVHRDWRLNERHYGALQGLNKVRVAAAATLALDDSALRCLRFGVAAVLARVEHCTAPPTRH